MCTRAPSRVYMYVFCFSSACDIQSSSRSCMPQAPKCSSMPCTKGFQSTPKCSSMPCTKGFQSTPKCSSMPCTKGFQSTPKCSSMPCTKGFQSTPKCSSMPCTKGFQPTRKTDSKVDVSPAGSVNFQRKASAITGLKKSQD